MGRRFRPRQAQLKQPPASVAGTERLCLNGIPKSFAMSGISKWISLISLIWCAYRQGYQRLVCRPCAQHFHSCHLTEQTVGTE
jgi:hypothetical protein